MIYCREHDIFDCWFHGDQGLKMDIFGFLGQLRPIIGRWFIWDEGDKVDVRVWTHRNVLFYSEPTLSVRLTNRVGVLIAYKAEPLA